jgi:1-acyl-sn-glycerol-3-phosphate acyltransferase
MKQEPGEGKIHYLNPWAKPGGSPADESTDLLREVRSRLDRIEKSLQGKLKKIDQKLRTRRNRPESLKALHRELKELKSNLQAQVQDVVGSLQTPLPPRFETRGPSWLKKLFSGDSNPEPANEPPPLQLDEEVDAFGRDPLFEQKLKPFFDFLYYKYWRVTTYGLDHIPAKGRALLVANHSGTLPWDGSMIRLAVTNDHPAQRDVRFLVEDFVYYLPFIGTIMYRIGGVRASPENAERLLNSDHLVAVFPEGVKGIGKYYSQRYHLQRFGRGGFIKLAIRTSSPIIPVAVIGAEEIHPMIYKSSLLAKPLGIPYVPVTPTFPFLGMLGLIPLPSKWSISFGEPIDLRRFGPQILDDELEIHKLSEKVRQKIQEMVTEALKQRRSVWWG